MISLAHALHIRQLVAERALLGIFSYIHLAQSLDFLLGCGATVWPWAPVGCPLHSTVHSSLASHQCCGASRDWTVTIGQSLVWGLLSCLQDKITSSCQNNTSYCVFQPALSALSFTPGPSDSQELRVQQLWINLGSRLTILLILPLHAGEGPHKTEHFSQEYEVELIKTLLLSSSS